MERQFTPDEIVRIRELRAWRQATAKTLARKYGVRDATINNICEGNTYADCGGPLWARKPSSTPQEPWPKPQGFSAADVAWARANNLVNCEARMIEAFLCGHRAVGAAS